MSPFVDIVYVSPFVDITSVSPYVDMVFVLTARDLGARIRARRQEVGLSQGALADRAGVSRQWIVAAEGGKPTVELAPVLRVLAALGLALDLGPAPADPPDVDLDDHLAGFVG
jgi:HTH-type transcriptional regulator/antitoxin HipB